jgi:hypothetical protein
MKTRPDPVFNPDSKPSDIFLLNILNSNPNPKLKYLGSEESPVHYWKSKKVTAKYAKICPYIGPIFLNYMCISKRNGSYIKSIFS